MTSFKKCIDDATAGKNMGSRGDDLKDAFDKYSEKLGPEGAQKALFDEVQGMVDKKRRRLESNAAAQKLIKAKIDAGLPISSIVEDFSHKGSLRMRHESVRAELRGEMSDVLAAFSANLVGGRRNVATLKNLVRERYGKRTGDGAAGDLAAAFGAAKQKAKEMYEKAGGTVRSDKDFGLPQSHSQVRIARASKGAWTNYVLKMIDVRKLVDDLGNPIPPGMANEALGRLYDNLSSGGWVARSDAERGAGGKLGQRNLDPDFLPFRDGDAWLKYHEDFGDQTDPFRVMVGYIDRMAQKVAELEVLGVDADASWGYAKELFLVKNKGSDKAKRQTSFADAMRDTWQGVTQEPESRMFARIMSNTRQYLSATQLGSAMISSISDVGTARAAAAYVGLSKGGHLNFVKHLMGSPEFRGAAREMSLILENAIDMGSAAHRYSMEDFTSETASRLSDFTMRASGLSGWTQISKDAVGMSALNDMAKMRKLPFADLPVNAQRAFEGFGINKDVWDAIRTKTKVQKVGGVEFLRPKEIEEAVGRDAAMSVMEFVNALQNRAVLTSSIRSQTVGRGNTKPGSVAGEALRTVMQYKTFPIEFILRPMGQIVTELQSGKTGSAAQQAAIIGIQMTLLGAVAMQLKELVKGREPKDMNSAKFWGGAVLQGGGLGLFGDFLFSNVNRHGQGLAGAVAGPTVDAFDKLRKLTAGNVMQAIQGEETNLGREAVKFATDYAGPIQSLWYTRLLFERYVEDNLMKLVDSDAKKRFNRQKSNAKRDGGGFWWEPGKALP